MDISLFDTHADTPYEAHKRRADLSSDSLHISLHKASAYTNYCQCMAIWSDRSLTDDQAFAKFSEIYGYFRTCVERTPFAEICQTYNDVEQAIKLGNRAFILTVEDARLLGGDIRRLDFLRQCGIRILTFQWQGETCIGGGFDTDAGLTEFGADVARACADQGIIPDISHANERTAQNIISIMGERGKPAIATHSNSYSVCQHKRNLTDSLLDSLVSIGGIVGISLAPQHLSIDGCADSETVLRHIEHYAQRCGIEHICLGCDLDGIETTPSDIRDLSEVTKIAECMLRHGYTEEHINALFYENARRFFAANL